jgi:hypothetical protein
MDEPTLRTLQSCANNFEAGLRDRWQEAVADDSEGLDPDPVFELLEEKYKEMPETTND